MGVDSRPRPVVGPGSEPRAAARRWRCVGVVGGLGPLAGAQFYRKLVEETPASSDDGHLPVVLISDPSIPSRLRCLLTGADSPGPALRRIVVQLRDAGAEVIAVPSSTTHAFYPDYSSVQGVECVHLIREVLDHVRGLGWQRIGLLGTTGARRASVYTAVADDEVHQEVHQKVEWVLPSGPGQDRLQEAIDLIKQDGPSPTAARKLDRAFEDALQAGVDGVVLACTELSLVDRLLSAPVPVVDATDVLVQACLRVARMGSDGD